MSDRKDSWVRSVSLPLPSLENNTADAERLASGIKALLDTEHLDLEIEVELLRELPQRLRQWRHQLRCTLFRDRRRWYLAGIHPPDDAPSPCGIAVDLGTTTVVLQLVDLSSGATLAELSFANPQAVVGPDILTRIHFSEKDGGLKELRQLILDGLNRNIDALCRRENRPAEEIMLVAIAGNTAMTHLFLGLPPQWMIREPYIPVVNRPGLLKARELGFTIHPGARVFMFPNNGSYFGGDLIAGILFSGIHRSEETAIMVDVGTNAEVVMGNAQWLIACAGAAGPALEGGVTRMGMAAGPGVIDQVEVDPISAEFQVRTIDGLPPRGICGSGLIDLAAQLFLRGMIDVRGKFNPSACGRRLTEIDEHLHLVVVPAKQSASGENLTISQADLDSLIRSKAAMFTILETISGTVGISLQDLKRFHVAGTFGAYIRPQSAVAIGMIPDLPMETYNVLGNSSLGGAAMLLKSTAAADQIDHIRDRITYLELNVNQDFMNRFSAAKFLPHTDLSRFPSVKPPARVD